MVIFELLLNRPGDNQHHVFDLRIFFDEYGPFAVGLVNCVHPQIWQLLGGEWSKQRVLRKHLSQFNLLNIGITRSYFDQSGINLLPQLGILSIINIPLLIILLQLILLTLQQYSRSPLRMHSLDNLRVSILQFADIWLCVLDVLVYLI